jgi:hypothetical protein
MRSRPLASVREGLDDRELERVWEEGKQLTADEAVALALAD